MNERERQLADAREDERVRHRSAKRIAVREKLIRDLERYRMTERSDVVDQLDDTDFAPGCFI